MYSVAEDLYRTKIHNEKLLRDVEHFREVVENFDKLYGPLTIFLKLNTPNGIAAIANGDLRDFAAAVETDPDLSQIFLQVRALYLLKKA